MSAYYVARAGEQPTGPLTAEEIEHGVASGAYGRDVLVCQAGDEQWSPLPDWLNARSAVVVPPPLPATAQAVPMPQGTIEIPCEANDRAAVRATRGRVNSLLTPGERIIAVAAQKMAPLSPEGVVLTTRRVIVVRPELAGLRMNFFDCMWIDVINVHLSEGIFGCTLTIKAASGTHAVERLEKDEARAVYRISQQLEEAARHGRRLNYLEDLRAGSAVLRVG